MGLEPADLIGMNRQEVQARVTTAGLTFRDMTPLPVDGVNRMVTDDSRPDRVNVWFAQDGSAERAELF